MTLIFTAETKFLGVHITEMLEWNTHVKSLRNKMSMVSFMMKSLKVIMNPLMIFIFQSPVTFMVWNTVWRGGLFK